MVHASHPRTLGSIPFHIFAFSSGPVWKNLIFSPSYLLHAAQRLSLYCYLTQSFSPLPQSYVMLGPSYPCLKNVAQEAVLHVVDTVTLRHAANGCIRKWETQ